MITSTCHCLAANMIIGQNPAAHAWTCAPAPKLSMYMQELKEEFDIDVKVLGIVGSKKMLLSDAPIDLASWQGQYKRCVPQQGASELLNAAVQLLDASQLCRKQSRQLLQQDCTPSWAACAWWSQTAASLWLGPVSCCSHMHRTPAQHGTWHMAAAVVASAGRPGS